MQVPHSDKLYQETRPDPIYVGPSSVKRIRAGLIYGTISALSDLLRGYNMSFLIKNRCGSSPT